MVAWGCLLIKANFHCRISLSAIKPIYCKATINYPFACPNLIQSKQKIRCKLINFLVNFCTLMFLICGMAPVLAWCSSLWPMQQQQNCPKLGLDLRRALKLIKDTNSWGKRWNHRRAFHFEKFDFYFSFKIFIFRIITGRINFGILCTKTLQILRWNDKI